MKSFHQFITEAYDHDVQSRSQIRKQREGGRSGQMRKKEPSEKRRVKSVGGGKTAPAKDYKPRKDIGADKVGTQSRAGVGYKKQQQPTQTKGVKLSAREQQKKAREERLASKSDGKSTPKDLKKAADKLLAKKTTKAVDPKYKPQKASGYTRHERRKVTRAGERLVKDIQKKKEKPASAYDPKL